MTVKDLINELAKFNPNMKVELSTEDFYHYSNIKEVRFSYHKKTVVVKGS